MNEIPEGRGPKANSVRNIWERTTFFMRKCNHEKLRDLAYWHRKTLKTLLDEAVSLYLKKQSKKSRGNEDTRQKK